MKTYNNLNVPKTVSLFAVTLLLAVGFTQSAHAELSSDLSPSICKKYENNDYKEESCEVKVFDDYSVCAGWYSYEDKKNSDNDVQRCDHHVQPDIGIMLALETASSSSIGAEDEVNMGNGYCSWYKTSYAESKSCTVTVENRKICYNYYYYHRYSDGYTVTRCEREVDLSFQ